MENKKLKNKVALVTGASKGLGKHIAFTLAEAGATVIVNYNSSKQAADLKVNKIIAKGHKAIAIKADVSNEKEVTELYRQIEVQTGTVDILVNNAGINPSKPLLEITLADFQQFIAVILTSAFLTTQAALTGMIAKNTDELSIFLQLPHNWVVLSGNIMLLQKQVCWA